MRDPEELVRELENALSSPAADSLREEILEEQRDAALETMRDGGVSAQDAEVLYDYLRKKWTGGRMVLAEVLLDDAEALIRANEWTTLAKKGERPRYLVRHGQSIVQATLYQDTGDIQLYLAGRGPMSLNSIQQLWQILSEPT